jgi:anti-sigma factor RsiW
MPRQHPTDYDLGLYAMGRLPGEDAAAVEEHLLLCAECWARKGGAGEYVGAMRAARAGRWSKDPSDMTFTPPAPNSGILSLTPVYTSARGPSRKSKPHRDRFFH